MSADLTLTPSEWATFPAQSSGWATPTHDQRNWIECLIAARVAAAEARGEQRVRARMEAEIASAQTFMLIPGITAARIRAALAAGDHTEGQA